MSHSNFKLKSQKTVRKPQAGGERAAQHGAVAPCSPAQPIPAGPAPQAPRPQHPRQVRAQPCLIPTAAAAAEPAPSSNASIRRDPTQEKRHKAAPQPGTDHTALPGTGKQRPQSFWVSSADASSRGHCLAEACLPHARDGLTLFPELHQGLFQAAQGGPGAAQPSRRKGFLSLSWVLCTLTRKHCCSSCFTNLQLPCQAAAASMCSGFMFQTRNSFTYTKPASLQAG